MPRQEALVTVESQRELDLFTGEQVERTFVKLYVAARRSGLLALTVSGPTAIAVLVAYVIYQQLENYILVPRVFRSSLQVSSITILLGILVGGQLLGVLGTLLALPITAAIPVFERVWNEEIPTELGD